MNTNTSLRMGLRAKALTVCVVLFMASSVSQATPTIGTTTWGSGGPVTWLSSPSALDAPTSGGAPGTGTGYLRYTFPGISEPSIPPTATIYSPDTIGSYLTPTVLGLRFHFSSTLLVPKSLYFTTGAHTWYRSFNNAAINTWELFTISFSQLAGSGWAASLPAYDNQTAFATDLLNVTQFGVAIYSTISASPQSYGIDNWEYYAPGDAVPEPGTIFMLGGVLISFGLAQRKRLTQLYHQRA